MRKGGVECAKFVAVEMGRPASHAAEGVGSPELRAMTHADLSL